MLRLREIPATLAEAFHGMIHDNCFLLAKAASYSAALALFPGLIVVAAILFRGNASRTMLDLSQAMGNVLPPEVHNLLVSYLSFSDDRSTLVLTLAGLAAVIFAADLTGSLMEGFRAAYNSPRRQSLWEDYAVAVLLVFLAIFPMTAANVAIILSKQIELWAGSRLGEGRWLAETSRLVWWAIALATFTLILAVQYYVAPNRRQRWRDVLPGAALAAALLAPTTGVFTFYVQRVARYGEFYGNISTVILLLIWTYMVSVIVMYGCEVNAARERRLGTLPSRPLERA